MDVAAILSYLARHMGHATFYCTYYHVHTSPDFMDGYADIVAEFDDSVTPELKFNA